jgi:hypothetical protein
MLFQRHMRNFFDTEISLSFSKFGQGLQRFKVGMGSCPAIKRLGLLEVSCELMHGIQPQ